VSLAGRALTQTIRATKLARKELQRRLRFTQRLMHHAKSAEKTLFFRLRDSNRGRVILKAVDFARAPREIQHRRQVAAPYIARIGRDLIDPAGGYGLVSPESVPADVMTSCRRLFETKKGKIEDQVAGFDTWSPEKRAKFLSRKSSFLRYLLKDEDLRRNPEIVDFALGDGTLGAATRYFGMVPYLSRVDLMYSLSRGVEDKISSQLFHLDHEGLTQIKFFINIFDVGEPQGPFTFLPANATSRVIADVRRLRRHQPGKDVESRRYLDEEVTEVGAARSVVTLAGPAGSGVAIDTSRCLHLGSRVQPGAFRLALYLQYCTTREITNVFDVKRFRDDPVRHLAVSHSIEPGRALAATYAQEMMRGA
jgi:hypothetical protein